MKKSIIFLFVIFVCFPAFCESHTCEYNMRTTNLGAPISASYQTYSGTILHCNYNGYLKTNSGGDSSAAKYTITMYSLPNSTEAWNTYVSNGYRLKYIGGNYWYTLADQSSRNDTLAVNSWAEEPSNLNDYIYPAYIDYLRPY